MDPSWRMTRLVTTVGVPEFVVKPSACHRTYLCWIIMVEQVQSS